VAVPAAMTVVIVAVSIVTRVVGTVAVRIRRVAGA
jgi:hypothetical protein